MNGPVEIPVTDIKGFLIGQSEDVPGGTGVTVVLNKEGATGAVDVRGGGPATRETDLLRPENMVEKINAVVLSGGSAFGLEASSGVMEWCREHEIGFGLGPYRVPIVVGASLFDLNAGNPLAYPDKVMGYDAVARAGETFMPGNHGAGTGATVAKMAGFENAVKSGIGSFALQMGELQIGAIVAVNAVGNIYNPQDHSLIAGVDPFAAPAASAERTNTTIGVILTNADLNKAGLTKVCQMAQDGLAHAIEPVHTPNDGDALFAMSTNEVPSDINIVGVLAAKVVEAAILNAVLSAESAYGYPSALSLRQPR